MSEDSIVTAGTTTPATLLEIAVSQGAELDKLEKLMDLQERWEANEAKKAYVRAMTKFKENPPRIMKEAKVDFTSTKGRTNYNYADLADITGAISATLAENGLSVAWPLKQTDGKISVTCRITHELGHFEETTLTADPDNSGNKNSIQAIASTISYLERYTVLAMTGLATHDMDDDGNVAGTEPISEEQFNEIHSLIKDNKLDKDTNYIKQLNKYLGADSLDTIPKAQFGKAKAAIMAAIKMQGVK